MTFGNRQDSSYISITRTNTALLDGLRSSGGQSAWPEFVQRFRPLIIRFARRFGLHKEDAEDAAQQTLLAFCSAFQNGKYDRHKGRLRSWLFGIASNQIKGVIRKIPPQEIQVGGDLEQTDYFARVPQEDRWEEIWEEEWRQNLLQQCLQRVRQEFDPKTVAAFELFAWKGWSARRVADHLDMSENAVFLAKYRVLRRLRELQPQIEDDGNGRLPS